MPPEERGKQEDSLQKLQDFEVCEQKNVCVGVVFMSAELDLDRALKKRLGGWWGGGGERHGKNADVQRKWLHVVSFPLKSSDFVPSFFSLCFCPGYFCGAVPALSRAAVNFSHVVAVLPCICSVTWALLVLFWFGLRQSPVI